MTRYNSSNDNFVYASIYSAFCDIVTDADGDSRSGSKEKLHKMPKPPPTRTITYKVKKNS